MTSKSGGDNARKALAREVVASQFPIDDPDRNIREHLDEIGEQIALADFLNGPIAKAVYIHTAFVWIPINYADLDNVQTVRDLGKIVYAPGFRFRSGFERPRPRASPHRAWYAAQRR